MGIRQLATDIETTGLSKVDDRIIELGAVELVDGIETGQTFTVRIKADRPINPDASKIHGIYDEDLADCLTFDEVVDEFLAFIGEDDLIIHNGLNFDGPFLDAELARVGRPPLRNKIVDTYVLAQRQFGRGAKLNLDALADRFGVDRSARTVHGALVDCVILARVFVAMTSSRNDLLGRNSTSVTHKASEKVMDTPFMPETARQRWFKSRPPVEIPASELEQHAAFVAKIPDAVWKSWMDASDV